MPLSQDQFDALVARLEAAAARNPGAYRLKLGAFASLGYLYVFGVLLALIAVCVMLGFAVVQGGAAVLVLKYALIPVVVLIGLVLRSLWVRLDAPRGLVLAPGDHPTLFAAIDEVRRSAKAPAADVVLLTNELNAAIVQVPRLGLLGWQRNYLILGLPLMQIMPLTELKAVLAHEFGHLSGAHGAFGAWIYRVRAGWARLHERLSQENHWGSFMFVPFFGWYAPKFLAYSFVQARRQEYEADLLASESYGAAPLAAALVRLDLKGEELSRNYWPGIFAEVDRSPAPTAAPFDGLLRPERRGFLPEAAEWLSQSLKRPTSTADTHPCLKDRIEAMRITAAVPPPVTQSAAEALFGPKLPDVVGHFDAEWRRSVAEWWSDRHAHVRTGREKLAGFRGRDVTLLDDDSLFEYARLAEEFDSVDAAFPLYEALAGAIRDLPARASRRRESCSIETTARLSPSSRR
jgi:Zn-dependent protease with chaperone function